jgi:hypothetical protein
VLVEAGELETQLVLTWAMAVQAGVVREVMVAALVKQPLEPSIQALVVVV